MKMLFVVLQACNCQARLQKDNTLVILYSLERVLQCFINPNDCIGFSEYVICHMEYILVNISVFRGDGH